MVNRALVCFALFCFILPNVVVCDVRAVERDRPTPRATIIVFGDGFEDYKAEVQKFADLVPIGQRPKIISTNSPDSEFRPDWKGNITLAFFAKTSRDQTTISRLPAPIKQFILKMKDWEAMAGKEVSPGVTAGIIGCYGDNAITETKTERYFDVFVHFTPVNDRFCRAQAFAALVGLGWEYCHHNDCKKILGN